MPTIQTLQQAGPDKILRLAIPVDEANQPYQVTITVEPVRKSEASVEAAPAETTIMQVRVSGKGWPPGFFDRTYGCLRDDPIKRGAQGEFEVREAIE